MNIIFSALMTAFFATLCYGNTLTQAPGWAAFESFAFDDQAGHRTHSLLVMHKGKIIFERHRPGFTPETPQQVWSISKSVTGFLIGQAIEDKLLNAQDSLQKYYPQAAKEVTLNHLLDMSSGLEWNEGYEYNPILSDVIRMLYTANYDDMASYAASKPLLHAPGSQFHYSSGTTNILMGVLARATGPGDYAQYPWRRLFNPLEITSATWERDAKGTFVGSSYLYISPRDLAKIGSLFLTGGKYRDKQIISAQWLERSQTMAPYFQNLVAQGEKSEGLAYSAQWWLNKTLPRADGNKPHHPDLPEDAIMGLGHWGQMLVVIPSLKIVMVRTGADKHGRLERDKFFALFMRAYQQGVTP